MKCILVVEDEQNVAAFLHRGLTEEGYRVLLAYDAQTALSLLGQHEIDMAVLDIILPGMNGLDLCAKIREQGFKHIPILMLTALGTSDNVVKGLDTGADDYLVKPFKFNELLARLRALQRRHNLSAGTNNLLKIADLVIDRDTKTAIRGEKEIRLTSTEYRLLEYFMKNQRKVLSRVDLLENVWDINFDLGTNVVDVYVSYLRNKIDKGFATKLIHTVVGMGYIMRDD